MNSKHNIRIIGLQFAIGAALLLLAWAEFKTVADWFDRRKTETQNFDQLLSRYNAVQSEYFLMASYLETSVGELQQALLRYATRSDREEWDRFQKKSQEFKDWIEARKRYLAPGKLIEMSGPLTLSVEPIRFLTEVEEVFGRYQNSANQFVESVAQTTDAAKRVDGLQRTGEESRKLLALAGKARAYGQGVQLTGTSPERLPWPHLLIVAALLVMAVSCAWMALVFYRRETVARQGSAPRN